MEKVREAAAVGGGKQPGVGPVPQVGGTGYPTVWVGVMGNVRCDDEGGGGNSRGIPSSDHGEADEAAGRGGMRESGDRGSPKGVKGVVGSQVHRPPVGTLVQWVDLSLLMDFCAWDID